MIYPNATLGILGGGQLGRFFTITARMMGYQVMVLDPDPNSPAGLIADKHLKANYQDQTALAQLGQQCQAITTEFENIPTESLNVLAQNSVVRPSAKALAITQNRILEKNFIHQNKLATAPFCPINHFDEIDSACQQFVAPYILKRASLGYDGKGQYRVANAKDVKTAFIAMENKPCVLEQQVDLKQEVSVILARDFQGHTQTYPIAENQHINGILAISKVPANISPVQSQQLQQMAIDIANALDYCGIMAVEFFITKNNDLLVNEIAPRPHNSGHYTMDACISSQFEQQVRMLTDLPFGSVKLLSPIVMVNLLGDLWQPTPNWQVVLQQANAKLHLYGKQHARAGRKMGHFCILDDNLETATMTAQKILERLC